MPDLVVSDMKKALRTGKVLVDWSQNDDHKTTVCVYSLRAKERPTVSTPVKWEEVESCLKKGDPSLLVFDSDKVLARAKKYGDLFEPVLKLKQKMPPVEALGQLEVGAPAKSAAVTKRAAEEGESQKKTGSRKTTTRGTSDFCSAQAALPDGQVAALIQTANSEWIRTTSPSLLEF